MSTQIATFSADGSWTAPAGVSLVWLTAIGGGGGATATYSIDGSAGHFTYNVGGAGAGELVTNLPVAVTPGVTYAVTVGTKGLGATTYNQQPPAAGPSIFNGFIALGAGPYLSAFFFDVNSGSGGGPGRARGAVNGDGSQSSFHQFQESCRHTGGSSGGRGSSGYPIENGYHSSSLGGNLGGQQGVVSGDPPPHDPDRPGGGGGGTLWGAVNGGNGKVATTVSAPSTYYGAGAGGGGSYPTGGETNGGNGCAGFVSLRWTGPPS